MIAVLKSNAATTLSPLAVAVLALLLLEPAAASAAVSPQFAPVEVTLGGQPAPAPSSPVCGFSLVAAGDGPQVAFMAKPAQCVVAARGEEQVCITIAAQGLPPSFTFQAEAVTAGGQRPSVTLSIDELESVTKLKFARTDLRVSREAGKPEAFIRLRFAGGVSNTAVRLRNLCVVSGDDRFAVPLVVMPAKVGPGAPPVLPPYRPAIEWALIEWDWRMQDGIDTEREPATYAAAVMKTLVACERLIADLRGAGAELAEQARQWDELYWRFRDLKDSQAARPEKLDGAGRTWESRWERLWIDAHALRRRTALANPLFKAGPIAFVKQVPGAFSHQLTQYYGRYAKPGG
ncbi:MAG: hypothetical protein NTW87_08710, partial [Planctomycetota bacterium]|nr:hypothetical protein [Planctomycetota bacterium]